MHTKFMKWFPRQCENASNILYGIGQQPHHDDVFLVLALCGKSARTDDLIDCVCKLTVLPRGYKCAQINGILSFTE